MSNVLPRASLTYALFAGLVAAFGVAENRPGLALTVALLLVWAAGVAAQPAE